MNEPLYEYGDWKLSRDGVCTHKGRQVVWYSDQRTRKPWIPAKRKTFVSLVKGMERDLQWATAWALLALKSRRAMGDLDPIPPYKPQNTTTPEIRTHPQT